MLALELHSSLAVSPADVVDNDVVILRLAEEEDAVILSCPRAPAPLEDVEPPRPWRLECYAVKALPTLTVVEHDVPSNHTTLGLIHVDVVPFTAQNGAVGHNRVFRAGVEPDSVVTGLDDEAVLDAPVPQAPYVNADGASRIIV